MKYLNYRYIYPPRPKNSIPHTELDFWDNGTLLSQPKLNGSNSMIYTDGAKIIVMNRHGQRLSNVQVSSSEILDIYRGNGWMILNCEYLNKNKKDETGESFNHKFVIFDILCHNSEYLIGSTFGERVQLLDGLYGQNSCRKDYLWSISENIFRVRTYTGEFLQLYQRLIEIDLIEGLVMKRTNARLELGTSENNNVKSQIKCRKPTKNYKF